MSGQDPVDAYLSTVEHLGRDLKRRLSEGAPATSSPALAMAQAAGLKPQLCYTVAETARYSGVDVHTLRSEHSAGRLRFVMPNGATKGYRIAVSEMDRWMEASQR